METVSEKKELRAKKSEGRRERSSLSVWAAKEAGQVGVSVPQPTVETRAMFDDEDDPWEARKFNKKADRAVTRFFIFAFSLLGFVTAFRAFLGTALLLLFTGTLTGTLFLSIVVGAVFIKFMHFAWTGKW
ncbi:MAG: hypothetical protein RLZZ283_375 [Candidatus Parcubacteria bacterium]